MTEGCPERSGDAPHRFQTVGADVEGYGSISTAALLECQDCGGIKRETRTRIEEDE